MKERFRDPSEHGSERVALRVDVPPGECRVVDVARRSITLVSKADGNVRALLNRCPHQGGPLGLGHLGPMITAADVGEYELMLDRFILRCPWHGYEFDVDSGCALVEGECRRVQTFPAWREGDQIIVLL
jgi:nitrite reductase/ring-hydroxylating ferredoxin subunit